MRLTKWETEKICGGSQEVLTGWGYGRCQIQETPSLKEPNHDSSTLAAAFD